MQDLNEVFIHSFKTKRADGINVRTIYAMYDNGIVHIERNFISKTLNPGYIEIRRFGEYIYQYEKMSFKLDSFLAIGYDVASNLHKLQEDKILTSLQHGNI